MVLPVVFGSSVGPTFNHPGILSFAEEFARRRLSMVATEHVSLAATLHLNVTTVVSTPVPSF